MCLLDLHCGWNEYRKWLFAACLLLPVLYVSTPSDHVPTRGDRIGDRIRLLLMVLYCFSPTTTLF